MDPMTVSPLKVGKVTNMITSVKAVTKWITKSFRKSQRKHFQLQDTTRNKIPDVAFNDNE